MTHVGAYGGPKHDQLVRACDGAPLALYDVMHVSTALAYYQRDVLGRELGCTACCAFVRERATVATCTPAEIRSRVNAAFGLRFGSSELETFAALLLRRFTLDGEPVGDVLDYLAANADTFEWDDIAAHATLAVGGELRYGGGAAALRVLRRIA